VWVRAEELHRFIAASICSLGASSNDAIHVADVLVAADLGRFESHGTARLCRYVNGVRQGRIAPQARIEVVRETQTTATLDAGNGLGQPAAVHAIRLAMAKAEAFGLAVTTLQRSNHFGIAGYYARMASREGMVAIVATNAMPQVAPTHGTQPMYGTNPLAVGLPDRRR
jgi:L-2-hydroxycarboxylate dehydrogenase (NAD+)